MRIVLDTNVLARAASGPPGLADELLLLCVAPPNLLCISPFMLAELARVLHYPRMRKVHGMTDVAIDDYIRELQMASLVVSVLPGDIDAVVPSDPKDDPIVATAVLSKAQILCTLDRHLHHAAVTTYCSDRGIAVLSDRELIHRLRGSTP